MAGISGFAAGGFADSFQRGQQLNIEQQSQTNLADFRQQELKLQQQSQQNQQQRDMFARADKSRTELTGVISQTIEQLKIAGHPNDQIAQQIQPLVQPLKKLTKSTGLDDSTIDAQIAAELAKPPKTQVMAKEAAASAAPGTSEKNFAQAEYYRSQARMFAPDGGGLSGPAPAGGAAPAPAAAAQPGASGPVAPADAAPGALNSPPPTGEGTQYIHSPYTGQQKAIVARSGATPEQFDFDAVMYAYGNTNVTTGYRSYRGINPVTVLRSRAAQYWIDRFPGEMGPTQANSVMTEFKAMQHGANTAANVDARMTQALQKANNTADIIPPLAAKVDRTRFKDYNDFMVNVDKRTGSQEEIRLGIALETLASNFGSTLGMGNSVLTDFQTTRAQKMLQQGWDKGQLAAAVDQIKIEIAREEKGTRQGMQTFIGGMQDTMRGGQGAPAQPAAPAQTAPTKRYIFNPSTGELE